jgi:hypothetical protein
MHTAPTIFLSHSHRQLLGTIRMEPTVPDVGRPYYRARTDLDVLAILETEPEPNPLWVRILVRILCIGGGGGSRTLNNVSSNTVMAHGFWSQVVDSLRLYA